MYRTALLFFINACFTLTVFSEERTSIALKHLNFDYYISLPSSYDGNRNRGYPVIYILNYWEAENSGLKKSFKIVGDIFKSAKLEPSIAVLIRLKASSSEDQKNALFLKPNTAQEIIEYIDLNYNTLPNSEGRLLIGGKVAALQGLTPPYLFKGVLLHNLCDSFNSKLVGKKSIYSALEEYSQQTIRIPFYIIANSDEKLPIPFQKNAAFNTCNALIEAVQFYQHIHRINLFKHHFNKYDEVPANPAELRINYLSQTTNFNGNEIAEGLKYLFENAITSPKKLDNNQSINQVTQKGTVLTNNAINGHDSLTYQVYLPYGYDAQDSIKYPVLYLLHGSGGNDESWNEFWTILDGMIERREISPVIAVAPISGNSYWVDSKKYGAIETTIIQDLIPVIDSSYRTIDQKSGRGIVGFSMGGYGALRYALTYPKLFTSAVLLSPAIQQAEPPMTSGAVTRGAFGEPFKLSKWQELNYPTALKTYSAQNDRTSFYIMTGDDEWNHLIEKEDLPKDAFRYNMEFQAVTLYNQLTNSNENNIVELNIVNGEHDLEVWFKGFQNGLKFMFSNGLSKPN